MKADDRLIREIAWLLFGVLITGVAFRQSVWLLHQAALMVGTAAGQLMTALNG
ncbi:MAG: hypothetical protein U0Z53_13545 [Blastocatellia bacterium]